MKKKSTTQRYNAWRKKHLKSSEPHLKMEIPVFSESDEFIDTFKVFDTKKRKRSIL